MTNNSQLGAALLIGAPGAFQVSCRVERGGAFFGVDLEQASQTSSSPISHQSVVVNRKSQIFSILKPIVRDRPCLCSPARDPPVRGTVTWCNGQTRYLALAFSRGIRTLYRVFSATAVKTELRIHDLSQRIQ